MRLTKEEFCRAVNTFQRMCDEEADITKCFGIGQEWICGNWLNDYYDFLIDMCDIDHSKETAYTENDLDYYCFELNFGRSWKPGMITIDDQDIPCRNAEELWELMIREDS